MSRPEDIFRMEETALIPAVFIKSNKGSDILVDEYQYQYLKQRGVGELSYWTCRQRKSHGCSARAISVVIDGVQYIREVNVRIFSLNLFFFLIQPDILVHLINRFLRY